MGPSMWCDAVRLKQLTPLSKEQPACVISGPNSVFYKPLAGPIPFLRRQALY